MQEGNWSLTVELVSIGYLDTDESDNNRTISLVVTGTGPSSIVQGDDDSLLLILLMLLIAATVPVIMIAWASIRLRKKGMVIAHKKLASARNFIETASEFGGDITMANIKLASSEAALNRDDYKESEKLSREARDEAMLSVAERGPGT